MKRTSSSLVAITGIIFVVTACGGPGTTPSDTQSSSRPVTSQSTPPDAPDESAVADFYQGQTIRILVGSPPGGGFDTYARTLAKYLPAYIPGEPNVIVENAEGNAGELLVANNVYNTEPQDGTVIGTFAEGTVLLDALGGEGIQFDSADFQWLGAATKGVYACLARRDSGVTTIDQVLDGGTSLTLGTAGPGSDLHGVPNIIKNRLGANFNLVSGYGGFSDLLLATESGEVDGFCATYETILGRAANLVEGEDAAASFLLVTGSAPPDDEILAGVPAWMELAGDAETEALLMLADAPREISKPYTFGPDVPADRVEAVRSAFAQAFADPDLIADLDAASLSVDFTPGAETSDIVDRIFNADEAVRETLSELLNG